MASTETTDLRKVMAEKIPAFQEEVKAFRKSFGNKVIGEITVDQVMNELAVRIQVLSIFVSVEKRYCAMARQ